MHGSQVLTCGVLLTMCRIPNWSLTSASFSCSVVCHLLTRWPTRIMWASCYTWNIFIAVDHVVFWTVLSSFPHSLHTAQESGWAVCNAVSVQGGESKMLLDSVSVSKEKKNYCMQNVCICHVGVPIKRYLNNALSLIMTKKWFEAALLPLTDSMLPLLNQSTLKSASTPTTVNCAANSLFMMVMKRMGMVCTTVCIWHSLPQVVDWDSLTWAESCS